MNFIKQTTLALAIGFSIASCNSGGSDSSSAKDTTKTVGTDSATMDTSKAVSTVGHAKKKIKASLGEMATPASKKYRKDKSGVYDNAEVMPSFKGGTSAISDYVNNNINPSQTALDDSKAGTVRVMFTIDENGNVMNAHAMGAKLGDGLDEEAVRVVSAMPKWSPGTIHGKPVKVNLDLPITFKAE
jgi:protein TonB